MFRNFRISKLDKRSFALLGGIIGVSLGLCCGLFYSIGGFILDLLVSLGWMTSAETSGLSKGTLLAFGALLGMPFIFGVVGLIGGYLTAMIFNLVSRIRNGIVIKYEET